MSNSYTSNPIYSLEYSEGINEYIDKSMLDNKSAYSAKNADVSSGVLKKAKGYSKYNTAKLDTVINSIMPFYKSGELTLLVASGSNIYKLSGNSFTQLDTGYTSDLFDSVNFKANEEMIILTNGKDNMKLYNGTTIRNVLNRRVEYNTDGTIKDYVDANGVVHSTTADITTLAPKAKCLELHAERLWAGGVSDNPDMLYFSTADTDGFDPEDWTAPISEGDANQHGGDIDNPTYDGGVIKGIKVSMSDLIVFKNKTIIRIFGTYPGNYTKDTIFTSNGTISDRSIANGENVLFFVDTNGIYMYDGTHVNKISNKIKRTWDTVNQSCLQYCVATYFNGKYILAVPTGSSTVNNTIIEYDTDSGNFMIKDGFEVKCFANLLDMVIFADGNGYLMKYDSGNTYDLSPINLDWQTGATLLGAANGVKSTQYIYFNASGDAPITITCTTERKSKSITITPTANMTPYKKKLKNKGRLFQFEISDTGGTSTIISPIEVSYEVDYD